MCDRRTADRQDVDDRIRARGSAAGVVIDAAARYREFVESDLLAVYDSTVDGQLLSCNQAFARLIGCATIADALSVDLGSLYAEPTSREQFVAAVKRDGRVENVRGKINSRRGEVVDVFLTGIGEFDQAGHLVGIHGYLIDISEWMQAQRVLRERVAYLLWVLADRTDVAGSRVSVN